MNATLKAVIVHRKGEPSWPSTNYWLRLENGGQAVEFDLLGISMNHNTFKLEIVEGLEICIPRHLVSMEEQA